MDSLRRRQCAAIGSRWVSVLRRVRGIRRPRRDTCDCPQSEAARLLAGLTCHLADNVLQRENVSLSTNGRGITVRGRLVSFETIVECNYVRIMHAKCYRLYRLTRRNRNAFPIT